MRWITRFTLYFVAGSAAVITGATALAGVIYALEMFGPRAMPFILFAGILAVFATIMVLEAKE